MPDSISSRIFRTFFLGGDFDPLGFLEAEGRPASYDFFLHEKSLFLIFLTGSRANHYSGWIRSVLLCRFVSSICQKLISKSVLWPFLFSVTKFRVRVQVCFFVFSSWTVIMIIIFSNSNHKLLGWFILSWWRGGGEALMEAPRRPSITKNESAAQWKSSWPLLDHMYQ